MPLKRIGNTVRAYHYSKADEPLRYLSGGAYGTGARGQEAGRLAGQSGLERSYFYLEGSRPQEGRLTPRPESGVGAGATYRGKLTGMYDLQENPLGLTERGNALERRLQEIGYRGYYDPQTGIAVSLRPNTEVTKVGDYRAQAEEALLRAQQLPDQPYYVTAENIPSRKTPMGAWLLEKAKDNPDLLDRYTDEVENLFEKSYLMRELDVPTYTTEQGYGAYENSIRPNIITRVPTREEAQRVADARGYLTQQDAVPFFSRVGEGPRGVNVRTENPVDALDRQRIYGNLGLDFTRSDLDALDFINYADETGPFSGMDDDQFARVINDYFSRRGDADVKLYEADTKYNPTAASWMRGGDVAGPGPGGRLGELRKRLEDYNRKFQSQHGRADPRVLALLAASTGAGALAAPAFVGTGGSSAGDIYDAGIAALSGGAQDIYQAGKNFVGALTGSDAPRESAPWFTPANPDNPILAGAGRAMQGVMGYTPPLSGRPLGQELGTIVDYLKGAGENVKNAFGDRIGDIMTTGAVLGSTIGLPGRQGRLLDPDMGGLSSTTAPARRSGVSTIRGAQRKGFPGIYKNPDELYRDILDRGLLAPESPALPQLFGVTRQDLSNMSFREGSPYEPYIPGLKKRPSGTAHADLVTKPANTGRLVDALQSVRGTPLATGMEGWYVMDPMYQRLLELTGDEAEAARRYIQLNTMMGIHSANSGVIPEINRGTAANWLYEQGRLDDYFQWGNSANRLTPDSLGILRPDRPVDMDAVKGHYAHSTAHGKPIRSYLEAGEITSDEPKVPSYIGASGVPGVGYGQQNMFPVGDAHFSRMTGLADVRPETKAGKNKWGASWSMPEAQQLQPWWAGVAEQAGYNPVQAQGVGWGLFAPQTGVKTPVAAPKLELLADQIVVAARRMGVTPEKARDMILMGEAHAGNIDPALLPYLALLGGGALAGGALMQEE